DTQERNAAGDRLKKRLSQTVLVERADNGGIVTDAGKDNRGGPAQLGWFGHPYRTRAKPLQRALDGGYVASAIVDERDGHSKPFVLGRTLLSRRSRLTANRKARAKALKMASIWWCDDRPYRQRRCTLTRAACAKPWKKSSSSSTVKSPTRSALIFACTTQ